MLVDTKTLVKKANFNQRLGAQLAISDHKKMYLTKQ